MNTPEKFDYYIGIDPGVQTGIAIWNAVTKSWEQIRTAKIHVAMEVVKKWATDRTKIRIEDARQRKWFGKSGREQLQGAGSIKRDCTIWEDYLHHLNVSFDLVPPKSNKTKITSDYFKKISCYEGVTSNHSRDAAMLVLGM